jgi:tRNA nucleotidyltransferase/poly(A) polymerase
MKQLEDQVLAWLAQHDVDIYLAGGSVRDRLLGRPLYDLDLTVAGDGLALARRLANRFGGAYYPLDDERGTGRVILGAASNQPLIIDVAQFRGPDLAADLADRDFTINALALDLGAAPDIKGDLDLQNGQEIIDPHGGLEDLRKGVIRPVSDSVIRNDPLRALRAVRFAGQLGFALDPSIEALIRRDISGLEDVSGERIRDELSKILALPAAAPRLRQLDELGLLSTMFPELEPLRGLEQSPPHHLGVHAHSLRAVAALESIVRIWGQQLGQATEEERHVAGTLAPFAGRIGQHLAQPLSDKRPRLVILKLTTLLHDLGKAPARSQDPDGKIRFFGHEALGTQLAGDALRRLRFANNEVRLALIVIRHHLRPLLLAAEESVSSRAVYRFFRDTDGTGVDVLLHALADHLATYAPGDGLRSRAALLTLVQRMLAAYWDRQRETVQPPKLINGRDLLAAFHLAPGPQIGAALELVREAQAAGEVQTREQALDLVRRWLASSKTSLEA